MNLQITELTGVSPTGAIQMAVCGSALGLYVAETGESSPADYGSFEYQTMIKMEKVGNYTEPNPTSLEIPQSLMVPPDWNILLAADNEGYLTNSEFGGGWNTLEYSAISSGKIVPQYAYNVEDTQNPHFVTNTSSNAAKQQYSSAIFSGYQLGIIGLEDQEGEQTPHVSGLVGSADAPVSVGRVFGDLSGGLPASLSLAYLVRKTVGPLAPSGAFCGTLNFATFDTSKNTLGVPVALMSDIEFCDFDLAVSGDYFCVLAVTGDGAPLLAMYDQTGKAIGSPNMPVGSWSNAGRWVMNPTIVATPGTDAGFSFAFIEMEGDTALGVYTGTLAPPKVAP